MARLGTFALVCLSVACSTPGNEEPVVIATSGAQAETDQQPTVTLRAGAARVSEVVARGRAANATFAVTAAGKLVKISGGNPTVMLDRATGSPAALPDGGVVVARASGEPGETDLWLVTESGSARALAAAPGPDDLPIAIPDGRVAFVSARTGIASLWIVDPARGDARQLTNRGLSVGGARVGFVPPPVEPIAVDPGSLEYDAGGGALWRVDLETGSAKRLARGAR